MGLSKERGLYFQEKWGEMEYRFANIEMKKEIERLNNIINELEKTLKELIKEQEEGYKKYPENWKERKSVCNTWLRSRDCYLCILNYLKELKGDDKQ